MKIFAELRLLVLFRRIARALEAQNELARERMALDYPGWARTKKLAPRASKLVDLGVAEVAEWNERWKEAHPDEVS